MNFGYMNIKIEDAVAKMSDAEYELRIMLWLRHGCEHSALYGDDGERTCNSCKIDFIRMSAEEIKSKFEEIALKQLNEEK